MSGTETVAVTVVPDPVAEALLYANSAKNYLTLAQGELSGDADPKAALEQTVDAETHLDRVIAILESLRTR